MFCITCYSIHNDNSIFVALLEILLSRRFVLFTMSHYVIIIASLLPVIAESRMARPEIKREFILIEPGAHRHLSGAISRAGATVRNIPE